MSDRVPFQARLDEDVLDEFRSYVKEIHGKTHGTLGREAENAIRDYMNESPDRRVERKIDEALTLLREKEGTRTHMSTAAERAQKISRQIHRENDEAVRGDDVERVIEDIGGYDHRTISRYKDRLKRRGLLYEHPGEANLWYTDKGVFFAQLDEEDVSPLEDYPDELEDEFWEWYEDGE